MTLIFDFLEFDRHQDSGYMQISVRGQQLCKKFENMQI